MTKTIEEVLKAKAELEAEISASLSRFARENGVSDISLSVSTERVFNYSDPLYFIVNAKIKIIL